MGGYKLKSIEQLESEYNTQTLILCANHSGSKPDPTVEDLREPRRQQAQFLSIVINS